MFKEELTRRLSRGMTEAILRKCAEEEQSPINFLLDFISEYADDSFFDMMCDLCGEYGLSVIDDDE